MNGKKTRIASFLSVALSLFLAGCEDWKGPYEVSETGGTLEVYAVSETLRITRTIAGERITPRRPKVNGVHTDIEWGGIPFTYIRMDGANGNGGKSFYLAAKAAYTSKYVYFLFQWPDQTENKLWRPLVYTGPDWNTAEVCSTMADSISLISPRYWTRSVEDEDRFAMVFEMSEVPGFRQRGCASFCHGPQDSMKTFAGKLDLWHWKASRSNAEYVDIYTGESRTQTGLCEDWILDETRMRQDEGDSFYAPNYSPGASDPQVGYVPIKIAGLSNEGFPKSRYVYWWTGKLFDKCDVKNPAAENEYWKTGNYAPSFAMRKRFTGESDPQLSDMSNVDIMAKGVWTSAAPGTGKWTLEIVRKLDTLHPQEDVEFEPGNPYYFSIAIMDNSGRVHSGSQPLILSFRPRA